MGVIELEISVEFQHHSAAQLFYNISRNTLIIYRQGACFTFTGPSQQSHWAVRLIRFAGRHLPIITFESRDSVGDHLTRGGVLIPWVPAAPPSLSSLS